MQQNTTEKTGVQVKLEQFEGPFELLVELINKKKLSIGEISLAEVADQYLEHLKNIENFPTKEVASFIVVAATLMLIKSRSLMPSLKLSNEEEEEIQDLEEQLRVYKQYSDLAAGLQKIFGKKIIFTKEPFFLSGGEAKNFFIPPQNVSVSDLKNILEEMLNRNSIKIKDDLPKAVIKKAISLEERINEIIAKIGDNIKMCFSEMHNHPDCQKGDLVVNFLALLELTKRGLIIIKQEENFGEIHFSAAEKI